MTLRNCFSASSIPAAVHRRPTSPEDQFLTLRWVVRTVLAYAGAVRPPEPMLSTAGHEWPAGRDWVLQPKWDGFRLLIGVDDAGRTRAWSRSGANLTEGVAALVAVFEGAARGSIFDGEVVAVAGSRSGRCRTSAPSAGPG
jgi:hypothetical protein